MLFARSERLLDRVEAITVNGLKSGFDTALAQLTNGVDEFADSHANYIFIFITPALFPGKTVTEQVK
jgi:hypothetical protein